MFIFIEKNAYLGTLIIISWSLCYPRLRDGFNILCKNIENELRVYLSRWVAFSLPKLEFLYVVLQQ